METGVVAVAFVVEERFGFVGFNRSSLGLDMCFGLSGFAGFACCLRLLCFLFWVCFVDCC